VVVQTAAADATIRRLQSREVRGTTGQPGDWTNRAGDLGFGSRGTLPRLVSEVSRSLLAVLAVA
jgi:hypothetical protein